MHKRARARTHLPPLAEVVGVAHELVREAPGAPPAPQQNACLTVLRENNVLVAQRGGAANVALRVCASHACV